MTVRLSQQGHIELQHVSCGSASPNNLAAPSRNLDVTHTLELCECTSKARTTGLTADFLPHLGIAQACTTTAATAAATRETGQLWLNAVF
jgi:hypothetical protein